MKQAIEKSLYYSPITTDQYSNCVATFEYSDKESLKTILGTFQENIDIITYFANKNDSCYDIFPYLVRYYQDFLLDKITSIVIINRRDFCIKLNRVNAGSELNLNRLDANDANSESLHLGSDANRIAVLKIDAVASEYNSKRSYFWYSTVFLIGLGLGYYSRSNYHFEMPSRII